MSCRLYSLGRYPSEGLLDYDEAKTRTGFVVIGFGIGHGVLLLWLLFKLASF
ncbi:hypothetical protein L9G16_10980 [Shewanella sp. A25]|nr:hypothetical protein [Shewanella shenzhenensis]